MCPDWSSIPRGLLSVIAERLSTIEESIRFGVVCRSWQSAAKQSQKPKELPWLMLAEKDDSDTRGFYSLCSNRVIQINVPGSRGRRCWGSPFGWIVMYGLDLEIHLYNPLSKMRLSLPPQRTFATQIDEDPQWLRDVYITKLMLTANPTSPNCLVVAVHQPKYILSFAKPSDLVWTLLSELALFDDAIIFRGNLYAVNRNGNIFVCQKLDGPQPEAVLFAHAPPDDISGADNKYLVDIDGVLCLVCRALDEIQTPTDAGEIEYDFRSDIFDVFKLDMNTKKWAEAKSLGDWCLFVETNSTYALKASDYPGSRRGCIYFTDDYEDFRRYTRGGDNGIYKFETEIIDRFPSSCHFHSFYSPPIWIMPCLE